MINLDRETRLSLSRFISKTFLRFERRAWLTKLWTKFKYRIISCRKKRSSCSRIQRLIISLILLIFLLTFIFDFEIKGFILMVYFVLQKKRHLLGQILIVSFLEFLLLNLLDLLVILLIFKGLYIPLFIPQNSLNYKVWNRYFYCLDFLLIFLA